MSTLPPFPEELPHSTGARLRLDPHRLLLALRQEAEQPEEILAAFELQRDCPTARGDRLNESGTRIWVRRRDNGIFDEAARTRIVEELGDGLLWLGPVHVLPFAGRQHDLCVLPDTLLVRLFDDSAGDDVFGFLAEHGEVDGALSELLGPYRYVRMADPILAPAYDVRSQLLAAFADLEAVKDFGFTPAERLGFSVDFDYMPQTVPAALHPNDPAYQDGSQWNLDRIRVSGPDPSGWDLQQGNVDVTIAVLDTKPDGGDDLPQMQPIDIRPDQEPTTAADDHGTNMAGIAAAVMNNERGIAGVAGGCAVLPICFSQWTATEVAMGINRATDAGADVVCLAASTPAWSPETIDPAIQTAFLAGVLLCVAVNNQGFSEGICYPATNNLVMACGASDRADMRAHVTTPQVWGSNYGPQLSVVAPGVEIPATASRGVAPDGGAAPPVDGTSAATAQVAGVAALVRLRNPDLHAFDVRGVIEASAARVGGPYHDVPGYTNGNWNAEMGYGRIDAFEALRTAPLVQPGDVPHLFAETPSAASGPVFILPVGDFATFTTSTMLDVQPDVRSAIRSLMEHVNILQATGDTDPHAPDVHHIDLDNVDVFDRIGTPLNIVQVGSGLSLVTTDEPPQQTEIMQRVCQCYDRARERLLSDANMQNDQHIPEQMLNNLTLREYVDFADFGLDVLFRHQPPQANPGGWLHRAWHRLTG